MDRVARLQFADRDGQRCIAPRRLRLRAQTGEARVHFLQRVGGGLGVGGLTARPALQAVQFAAHARNLVFGLPVRLFEDRGALLLYPVPSLGERQAQLLALLARHLRTAPRFRRRHAFLPDLGEELLHLEVLGRKLLLRSLQHPLIQAEPPGDGDRVGLPGKADRQVVGRAQGFDIELNVGVAQARVVVRERLQFAVVRGRDEGAAAFEQPFEDRPGERRALRWVCAGAEFIEQHERPRLGPFEDAPHVSHVGRERGKRLLDALLVANVSEDARVDNHLAAVVAGHRQPGLGHQREQPEGLQRDRLPARVRPRNQHAGVVAAHGEVRRHDLAAQKWVAPALDHRRARILQPARSVARRGQVRLQFPRQARLRVEQVQPAEGEHAPLRFIFASAEQPSQPLKDLADFAAFGELEFAHLVAGLDHGHRLNEHRRAARRNVVHDARERALVVRLYGDNLAPVALRQEPFLGDPAPDRLRQRRLGTLFEPVLGDPQLPPRRPELRAGAIRDLAPRRDRFINRVAEPAEVRHAVRYLTERRYAGAHPLDHLLGSPGGAQGLGRVHEIRRVQYLADGARMDERTDVLRPRERHVDPELVEQAHLRGLRLKLQRVAILGRRAHLAGEFAANAKGRLRREQAEHLFELQDAQGVFVHANQPTGAGASIQRETPYSAVASMTGPSSAALRGVARTGVNASRWASTSGRSCFGATGREGAAFRTCPRAARGPYPSRGAFSSPQKGQAIQA